MKSGGKQVRNFSSTAGQVQQLLYEKIGQELIQRLILEQEMAVRLAMPLLLPHQIMWLVAEVRLHN